MADPREGGPHPTSPTALQATAACWPSLGAGPSSNPSGDKPRGHPSVFNPAAPVPRSAALCAGEAQGRPTTEANAAEGSAPDGASACGAAAVRLPAALASGANPSPVGAPSFAQVLLRSLQPVVAPFPVHPPARTDAGEPAAFFTQEEINWSCQPLQMAVIARTPQGRPPFPEIRTHLAQRFKFQRDFVISSLDNRHLLIRFQDNEDFLQVLLKETMLVQGRIFKFFRWSIDFCPDMDSPVVPLWLELPQLPANFFNVAMIRSIAGSLGPVLKVDRNTLTLSCTQSARVNVQLDVSKKLPERLWVGCGSKGFWQPITYPGPPLFCSACRRLGHSPATCKKTAAHPAQGQGGTGPEQSAREAYRVNVNGPRPMENRKWRPVMFRDVPSVSMGAQQTPLVVKDDATRTAHHPLDDMPTQQSPPQIEQGLAPEVQKGNSVLSSSAYHIDDGHGMLPSTTFSPTKDTHVSLAPSGSRHCPTAVDAAAPAHGPAQDSHAQQPSPVRAPMATAPSHAQQPSPVRGPMATAPSHATAPHLFDEMPIQQPPSHLLKDPISGVQKGGPDLPSDAHLTNDGNEAVIDMPPCTPLVPPLVQAPMASVSSTPSDRALKDSANAPLHDSVYGTPLQLGTHHIAPKSDIAAPIKLKPAATATDISACQMLDELSPPGQHTIKDCSATLEMPQPTNSKVAIQQGSKSSILNPNSPTWQPARVQDPYTPTAAAKADHLLDDPNQFARFLEGSPMEVTPAPLAAKCSESSPTTSRLSFAEALRKKTKKSGPWPPPPGPPPAMAARPAPFQPAAPIPGHHGAYMINLPPMFNIRSAPGLEPPGELTSRQLNTLHVDFAGRPRTRSTTISAPASDEDYEDRSD